MPFGLLEHQNSVSLLFGFPQRPIRATISGPNTVPANAVERVMRSHRPPGQAPERMFTLRGSNHDQPVQNGDLVSHRTQDVARQFPGLLDDTELEQVSQRVRRLTNSIEELRKYQLENGDEPAPVFRPVGKEQP